MKSELHVLFRNGSGFQRVIGRKRTIQEGPSIVELEPAETAMIQFSPGKSGPQVPEAGGHFVDPVPLFQRSQTGGSAAGATAAIPESVSKSRNKLFLLALGALIDRQVTESLKGTAALAL